MNQTITTIYQNFLEEVHQAAATDTRHFGFLARMLTGKQSEVEKLLPGFDGRVKHELDCLSEDHAGSAEIRELAEWMLEQADAQKDNPQTKYALMAVQRHLAPLIGCLSREDAAYLADRFEAAFPRRERFPSHTALIKKLKEQSRSTNGMNP